MAGSHRKDLKEGDRMWSVAGKDGKLSLLYLWRSLVTLGRRGRPCLGHGPGLRWQGCGQGEPKSAG